MLLQEEWQALAEPGALAQSIVINRMVQVGIQYPKEPTLKLACSIAAYFSADRASLKAEDFKRRLHCFKAEFKRQAERDAPTMSGLEYPAIGLVISQIRKFTARAGCSQ